MKVQHIMLKAPRTTMKVQHVKNIDHIRQSWLSIHYCAKIDIIGSLYLYLCMVNNNISLVQFVETCKL